MRAVTWVTAAAAALAFTGVGVAATADVTIPGTPAPIASEVAPFDVTGVLYIHHLWNRTSTGCAGTRGYNDMREGTNITVWDAEGKIVGSGHLGSGVPVGTMCEFPWTVQGVPPGRGPYQYEVAHRGRLTMTEDAARGVLAAELGTR